MRRQHRDADHRREENRHEPRGNERHGDDGEQRVGVLAGAVVGEADRQEAEDGDQGARQHREGRGGIGEGRGLHLVHAFFDLGDHHLRRDHRIVDEEAERDDEGAEGDALQADAHQLHRHEDDDEDERDRQGDDEPGAEAEADEAHREHDHDRFDERLGELADGLAHDLGLIGHEVELDADRKALHQAFGRMVQALAEGEVVAAVAHVDADADGRLAVDAEHLGGRVAVAALDRGDVGELVEVSVDPEVQVSDVLRRHERAGDVDQHVLMRRVDHAGGNHGVLLGDRREHPLEAQVEVGELLRREAQVHLLILVAEDLDLADVRRAQELGSRGLGEVARLARREAVVGDAVDDAEDVAELVVEEGPDHALRQGHPHVVDLLADLVPGVLDLFARRRFLEVDEDGRLARLGVALEVVEVGRLLELLLEPVGQLREGVGDAGAGPGGLHDHGLDREVGVLFAAQPLVGAQSADEADQHEEDGDGAVVHRPFGKVEAGHH